MKEHGYPNPVHYVLCCDPDHVPVCDQPHEAGIPRGEQPTAPPSTLPERKAGQEEHGAMRCIFCQPQLRLFLLVQHRNVSLYILYLLSPFVYRSCLPQSMFATLSQRTNKKPTMQWHWTKHFISELKFCCRTQEQAETIQMVDKT